jgi:hypothetical protein
MKNNKNIFIYAIIAFAICMTIIEILLNLQSKEVSATSQSVWGTVFLLLSILWVYYDADRKDFNKPFDFGFLVYVFWPIALPWYLIYTRGLEGFLIFLGLISLWLGPWLAGLVAYVYFT